MPPLSAGPSSSLARSFQVSASEFKEFVKCAQRVMSAAPTKRKQYVLAASNTGELRQRFDEVALDNRAALKQQITRECAA